MTRQYNQQTETNTKIDVPFMKEKEVVVGLVLTLAGWCACTCVGRESGEGRGGRER